ncbi:3-dehydroquinate synthase [Candidatus Kaiserbacteria bacterium RIFCSPHIGHO2_12_FULL_53_13]|uniref:3-dehydroquinate synthase n=1 Tax=Candidatus Kaiserbacteria bacterium RIFCSPHIGHO2_12_FULL_53_13 TaxID=1798502 RepID=A0A1F6EA44_9BACT|nr:MAG: 3-dehydroquinate synthase [Candidatus Kaiserbacteria bacterium RIFCSPHIGHO2_12_FULL_53_13]OGG74588.1 MAG: 3-dehydroquinate synthase [Candidatus Kaiserbacteria bacterium RIFCSPLOWO2_01_FULL_52_36]
MNTRTHVKTIWAGARKSEKYPLVIGSGLQKELLAVVRREGRERRLAIITDNHVGKIWGQDLLKSLRRSGLPVELIHFPQGEGHKNQKTVTALQHELLKRRFGRDTLIIALGGGVVGDVAGFVAATYLRGVPYVNVPTTLLAMVDSSIGGKVGIDTPYGKNTVGAFWQPRAVVMDLRYLRGMPRRAIVNGLMEAVKTSLTSDGKGFPLALKLDLDQPLRTAGVLLRIIHSSARIKTGVTERDVREENERRLLNFGHTIGHALELLSGYRLPHGYAVGYGMLVESKISELLGVLSPLEFREVRNTLAKFGISTAALRRYPVNKILEATKRDKKTRAGVSHYVLLQSIGSVYKKAGQFAHPVPDAVVRKALVSLVS